MSTFAFNKIFILESLLPTETQTGTELEKRLNAWAPSQGINCQVVTFQVHSMQDWDVAWNGIYTGISQMGNVPIIHLEMHGNDTHVGIDKGNHGIISLIDVFRKVQHANVLSQNNIFLSLAVCEGLNIINSLGVYQPMPFCGVLGSKETLVNDELLENYTVFYKAFLTSLNLDKAEAAMKAAGIDAEKYQLKKPEKIFMDAYLGYLETYKTDEQIEIKALAAAREGGIAFKSEEEKASFIRDYRCTLLMTENREYQHAVDAYFMFDKYPEIRERFQILPTIYEFKQFAAQYEGNEWLVVKRPLTIGDVKGLSLQILHEVDGFCSQHNIKYSLAYGTLLGAVRHKGFIPWDDDVDIMMSRPDYEKFVSEYPHDDESQFSVASFETDKDFHYALAKIVCNATVNDELGYDKYGFGIDLFPIDKIPINCQDAVRLLKQQHRSWNLFMIKAMKWDTKRGLLKNLLMCIAKVICVFVPYSYIHRTMSNRVNKYKQLTGYKMGCLFSPYGEREIMNKNIYEQIVALPFENDQYSCIKEYDRYLTNIYGDYMKLPPEEKRVSTHSINAWWK